MTPPGAPPPDPREGATMKNHRLVVRLSEEERLVIRQRAESSGLSLAEYTRSRLLREEQSVSSRPKGGKATCRGDLVKLRISPEAKEEIRSKAKSAGLSLSSYVRRAALERDIVHLFDQEAVKQLKRIGRNLNQAVYFMHKGDFSDGVKENLRRCLVALNLVVTR